MLEKMFINIIFLIAILLIFDCVQNTYQSNRHINYHTYHCS